jgi:hypothetical protein
VTKLPEPAPIYREKPTPESAVEEVIPEPTFEVEPATEAVTPAAEPEPVPAAACLFQSFQIVPKFRN